MEARETYRELAEGISGIPLFLRPWWLDATCGAEGWSVALVTKSNELHAALPYRHTKRRGFDVLSQPLLTPFLGPWLRPTGAKAANEYGRQKDLMMALIEQLPRYDQYRQNWSPEVTNWLPFYWRGFSQTTGYTYVIPDMSDLGLVWSGLRENIRREIRRAKDRFGLIVTSGNDVEAFQVLNRQTFARQERIRPYSDEYVRRLDAACAGHGARNIFIARDADGRAHAGVYVVWDEHKAYYLMGGGDPELRTSGATSLCMWEAIRFASGVTRAFDFEGSMIEPIERFFRAFGAVQVPYFRVSNTPSRLLSAGLGIKSWLAAR